MKILHSAFIILCLTSSGSAQETGTLSILSYNIRYQNSHDGEDSWQNRSQAVIDTLKSADLFGLQEATFPQIEDVASGLKGYTYYGVSREDGKQKGEATPIFFRQDLFATIDKGTFWLSPTPDKVGVAGWDAALPRIASWTILTHLPTKKELLVINTHFDHKGPLARLESARLLVNKLPELSGNRPVILMGDFNAVRGSDPYNVLADSHLLSNSYCVSQSKPSGPIGTFNGFKAILEDATIDHLFVTQEINVMSHATLDPKTETGRFASDHQPVQITIGW